ncbi:MAG: hypothetical protein H0U52_09545 [Chloroflexi bacterium]|nr:hypothetical protein [Chloroflexota bacterium]
MTETRFEALVVDWLSDRAPAAAPEALHGTVVDHARRTAQRRVGWRSTSVLAVAAVVAGLLLAAFAALLVAGSPPPAPDGPRASTQAFNVPFTYSVSAAADLGVADGDLIIEFNTGPSAASAVLTGPRTGAGVLIASIATPVVHGPDGRRSIRSDPSGFFEDLAAWGHLTVGRARDATVVGRPARAADVGPRFGDCSTMPCDVHVTGGLFQGFYLTEPGALFALDVDGEPLAILVWAETDERLAAFMPTADALLASIRFEER